MWALSIQGSSLLRESIRAFISYWKRVGRQVRWGQKLWNTLEFNISPPRSQVLFIKQRISATSTRSLCVMNISPFFSQCDGFFSGWVFTVLLRLLSETEKHAFHCVFRDRLVYSGEVLSGCLCRRCTMTIMSWCCSCVSSSLLCFNFAELHVVGWRETSHLARMDLFYYQRGFPVQQNWSREWCLIMGKKFPCWIKVCEPLRSLTGLHGSGRPISCRTGGRGKNPSSLCR